MELPYKEHIIELFNKGVLGRIGSDWYFKNGYKVVYSNGKVVDIVSVKNEEERNVEI